MMSNIIMAAGVVGAVIAGLLTMLQPVFLASLLIGALAGYLLARNTLVQYFAQVSLRRSYVWFTALAVTIFIAMPSFYVDLG